MFEFLQANWLWLLLGGGLLWFLFRRGGHGMGCGMGSHGSQGSEWTRTTSAGDDDGPVDHGEERPARSGSRRSGHGCC